VGEAAIDVTLRRCTGPAESRLQQLQDALKCGTNCGSCVPELKRLVRLRLQAA
jgi:assimilatory nitrate reductase catalytic subunit